MRLAPSSGRIRKSPDNHHVVGQLIRNPALRPWKFPTISTAIHKERKRTKKKENRRRRYPFVLQNPLQESNYKGSGIGVFSDAARGGFRKL
jgi:hypothetical protein